MRLRQCAILIAALLLPPTAAQAQSFQQQPQQPPAQGFAAPARQEPPCFKEFSRMRDDSQNKAKLVIEANKKKVAPPEACKLLRSLVASEDKLVKYVEDNSAWCGIPPQVVTQMKKQHASTTNLRDKVCHLASRPAAPRGPSLSDALGTSRLPDSSNIRAGRGGGTFNTLTGTLGGQ